MIPLVSGYLEVYACMDPNIKANFEFHKYTTTIDKPGEALVTELAEQNSDIYAFSCYVWNMALIKALLPPLLKHKPDAFFLLGGPQVMHHARDYLNPDFERLLTCNGEGEKTFAKFLLEVGTDQPDFFKVRGLSFYQNGTLHTTEQEDRINSLDEVPSPFLNGVFKGNYLMGIIETNRGCPFRCGFCFWGAATNDKVIKYSEQRIKQEITWMSQNDTSFIWIADANWGLLKRDIDIAKHISECTKQYGLPVYVNFSAAKNSPKRVAEITEIFTSAGLLNYQPISMQSLNSESLDFVDRTNIKLNAFEELQEDLNYRKISSFIELIWPLPGETLISFKLGIELLAERNAGVIVVYPHLLLHNTPLHDKKEVYNFVTRAANDGISECEAVIQTNNVSYEDFKNGMRFYFSVMALYNTQSLQDLSEYLHSNGTMTFHHLYDAFALYCKNQQQNPFSKYCEQSIEEAEYFDMSNFPLLYHSILHDERNAFDLLLYDFASSQLWWDDENARLLFEIGILSRPFIYNNTPVEKPQFELSLINILEASDRSYVIEYPKQFEFLLNRSNRLIPENTCKTKSNYRLDHKRGQYTYRSEQNKRRKADYCHGSIMKIAKFLPQWTTV